MGGGHIMIFRDVTWNIFGVEIDEKITGIWNILDFVKHVFILHVRVAICANFNNQYNKYRGNKNIYCGIKTAINDWVTKSIIFFTLNWELFKSNNSNFSKIIVYNILSKEYKLLRMLIPMGVNLTQALLILCFNLYISNLTLIFNRGNLALRILQRGFVFPTFSSRQIDNKNRKR